MEKKDAIFFCQSKINWYKGEVRISEKNIIISSDSFTKREKIYMHNKWIDTKPILINRIDKSLILYFVKLSLVLYFTKLSFILIDNHPIFINIRNDKSFMLIYASPSPINFIDKSFILIDNSSIFSLYDGDKSLILYDINKYLTLGELNKHWSIIIYKEKVKSLTIYIKPNLSLSPQKKIIFDISGLFLYKKLYIFHS